MSIFLVNKRLVLVGILMIFKGWYSPIQGQDASKDSTAVQYSETSDEGFERGAYRARISEDYLRKFTELSDRLQLKEEELASLFYRIEAVKDRSKEVKEEEQKILFKENIKSLKISQDELESEVKLLKRALRLLQENKSNPDPAKMKTLTEVDNIEAEIRQIKRNSTEAKNEIVESAITIDQRDVYTDPPKEACEVAYNGIDAKTDKLRKEIAKDFLFGYTHPKLKNFFKKEHFLTCEIKLLELDKKKYLWMYITISSKDAIKNYGFIEKNSPMKFELLNGEILYAMSAQNAIGRLEPYTGNTLYEVVLPLDKSKYRQFRKGELDKVGIMWTSGYEQYEVFNVDVIMNQIECLDNL